MKPHALLATVIIGATASLTATSIYAQSTCPSFLCMAGKVQGKQNVPGCDAPIEAFFFAHALCLRRGRHRLAGHRREPATVA